MSYITANKSLSNRLTDDTRSLNRRRSSILGDDLIAGAAGSGGRLFDIPPVERQARFEEWIKLTTDNKINTSNSWGVALIDYFHDMEVFRDGDGINFQKLSTTLDGCVKIYSSRIDSVITETGKLLSGLATKKNGEEEDDGEDKDGESDGEIEENTDENGVVKGSEFKRHKKKSDSTLKKWREVKMRSLDQELSIDPLFKKTLAEFDEGGAKSLLMHMLTVDKDVRIMFDTSTAASSGVVDEESVKQLKKKERVINISSLKSSFFGDLNNFDEELEICPSLGQLEDVVRDIEKAKTVLKDINYDSSYNYSITGTRYDADNSIGSLNQATQAVLFNDNFDNDNFGEGDAIDAGFDNNDDDDDTDEKENHNNENNDNNNNNEASGFFANTTINDTDDAEVDNQVLNYFDEQLKSNWKGPVHWKVKALKRNFQSYKDKPEEDGSASVLNGVDVKLMTLKRLRKEDLKINFLDEEEISDEDIFRVYKNSKININLKEAEDFNLLPDDTFFSSKNLIHLFTKEEQTLKLFKSKKNLIDEHVVPQEEVPDENFWANNYDEGGPVGEFEPEQPLGGLLRVGDDDDDDDDDLGVEPESQEFGTQLFSNQKSKNRKTMNFARVAKRVDLIALKDNIWNSIEKVDKSEVLEFKKLVRSTVKVYPPEEKKDLSTSFEFIALLHLANEKGLVIESNDDYSNLFITLQS